jgi:hypothetical protein
LEKALEFYNLVWSSNSSNVKELPMQSDIANVDITTINIQLNELRSRFDQAMRENDESVNLKETYLQIKELECYLNALQWDPEHNLVSRHSQTANWW